MAVTKKGNIREYYADGIAIQPGFKLVEKDDGTIEGTVTFECDRDDLPRLPQVGSTHPAEARCECYAREITYMGLRKVSMVGSYFGLVSAKTKEIVNYTPNTDREAIEAAPHFTNIAGTSSEPLNGAEFDPETGEFIGFMDPENDLFGVRFRLTPSTLVSTTHWSRNKPSLKKRMTIVNSVRGFTPPPGVKDFLLLDNPYRQVGSHYQITTLYMGSGENGFNPKVYPQ